MPWFNLCPVQDPNMNIAKNAGKRALASTAIRGKVLTIDTMNDRVKQVK